MKRPNKAARSGGGGRGGEGIGRRDGRRQAALRTQNRTKRTVPTACLRTGAAEQSPSRPVTPDLRQEPGAGKPHAGICAGAGRNPCPYRDWSNSPARSASTWRRCISIDGIAKRARRLVFLAGIGEYLRGVPPYLGGSGISPDKALVRRTGDGSEMTRENDRQQKAGRSFFAPIGGLRCALRDDKSSWGSGRLRAASPSPAPAVANANPEVRWRDDLGLSAELDLIFGGAQTFAQALSDITDGHFTVAVSPAGEIAPALETLDAVAEGRSNARTARCPITGTRIRPTYSARRRLSA